MDQFPFKRPPRHDSFMRMLGGTLRTWRAPALAGEVKSEWPRPFVNDSEELVDPLAGAIWIGTEVDPVDKHPAPPLKSRR